MKLSELYRERIQSIQACMEPQGIAAGGIVKSIELADEATDLAHCIAAFGDLDIGSVDHKKLIRESSAWTFPGRCSWRKGLALAVRSMRAKKRGAVST
jgi:hypothetical protein